MTEHLTRFWNWPELLAEFLAQRRETPFEWGTNDCALFAADAVKCITGIDLAAELRGTYEDAAGAARVLKDAGGLEQIVTETLGEPIAWEQAKRGDVVMAEMEGRTTLAICDGTMLAGPGEHGLSYLPMHAHALAAWEI